jgi:8-oxo-dGTP diphosphatase
MGRRQIVVVGAMIEQDGKYLITQRSPRGSLPLKWEFPGGRTEEGESDTVALARELLERTGLEVEVRERVVHAEHTYPDYDIDFRVYRCRLTGGTINDLRVHDHRWVAPRELDQYDFPPADQKTFELLLNLKDG